MFSSATAYDALNRPTSLTAPDSSEIRPTYNEAGLLEKVEARVRGAAAWTTFVDDIAYDAKGQREKIVYGNGARTTYTYDPETFRLVQLKTVRPNDEAGPPNLIKDGAVLQNVAYAYDPVGNIIAIRDSAQSTVFFDNDVVTPSTRYVYDALYRLIEAQGREHAGGMADVQRDQNDVPLLNLPHANDTQALRNYVEQYVYDAVGNLLTMSHQAGVGSWTRRYQIAGTSNRLLSTSLPGDAALAPYSATYEYDAHGSMTSMPHLPAIGWDHNDQMQQVGLGTRIAVSSAGDVALTGSTSGTVDFGGGPLVSAGSDNVFVAKLDAAGTHMSSRRFGSLSTSWVYINGVAFADPKSLAITGDFKGTVDFGGGALMSGVGGAHAFLAKLRLP